VIRLLLMLCAGVMMVAKLHGAPAVIPLQIALVEAEAVTPATLTQWKTDGFKAVAVVLDERTDEAAYRATARHISSAALDLYWWIEVARNARLAAAHPRWMASLGSHDDWQKNFRNLAEPKIGEIAKAYPWVPINYQEAFDAHLSRIDQLLQRVPRDWKGLLLNDLQAGPSSCGCGNLQCRWAVDYHVRSTATKLEGDDVAAKFIAEISKRAAGKALIPVWTTECEEVDLPPDKNRGRPGTGLCGSVGCATGACPDAFTRQWSALASAHDGPIGLLALQTAFQRTQKQFGGGPGWVTNAIAYLNQTVPANGGKSVSADRLWVVVEDASAREVAAKVGVGAVIVARTKIDQSYEPRMIPKDN
jgi:hypothetical protein